MRRCTTVTVPIIFDDLDGQPSDLQIIIALKDGLDYHGIDHEEIFITGHESQERPDYYPQDAIDDPVLASLFKRLEVANGSDR